MLSGSSQAKRLRDDSESKARETLKLAEIVSKNGGNLLSDNLETNSFMSAGLLSSGVLNNNNKDTTKQNELKVSYQSLTLKPMTS